MSYQLDWQLELVEPFLLQEIKNDAGQLLQQCFEARSLGVQAFEIARLDEPDPASALYAAFTTMRPLVMS